MAFDPKLLPAKVYEAFDLGPGAWPLVVERAIEAKITDVDKIANMVFYMHHPERLGRPLTADETTLIKEWKAFRTLVKPRVEAAAEVRYSTKSADPEIARWNFENAWPTKGEY